MSASNRYSKASLCLVLLGGLIAGAPLAQASQDRTPEVIPAQVCGGNADSDGDGVNECDDRCPGTIRGEAVDQYGCPLPIPVEPKPFRG